MMLPKKSTQSSSRPAKINNAGKQKIETFHRALTNCSIKQTKYKQKNQRLVLAHSAFQIKNATRSHFYFFTKLEPSQVTNSLCHQAESDCCITWTWARWEILAHNQDKLLQNVASPCNMKRSENQWEAFSHRAYQPRYDLMRFCRHSGDASWNRPGENFQLRP